MSLSNDLVKMYFHYCLSVVIVCSLFAGIIWAMLDAAQMPDVHFSNSTGECVRVINYDDRFNYTCGNYPEKYNHVWVQ